MSLIKLEIVTPTGAILSEEVTSVVAPGASGELNILPDHRPGLIMLGGGHLRYQSPKGAGEVILRGGVAEVGPERCLILADEAYVEGAADKKVGESILEEARQALVEAGYLTDEEFDQIASDTRFAEALM